MKNYKDFIYDKNDILVVIAILIIAAALIFWRVSVIVNYPKTLSHQIGTDDTTQSSAVENDKTNNANTESGSEGGTKTDGSIWSDGVLASDITVAVQSGSATSAVQSLIDAGLFESYDQFSQVCKAAGYTPENIKATTFVFKAGSTQTDIANKVTQ